MRRLGVGIAVGMLALAACDNALGIDDVLGIWNAISVDGHAVPGPVEIGGHTFDVQYHRFTFLDGGLCVLSASIDGTVSSTDECGYSVDFEGETIAILLYDAVHIDGAIDGSTMTVVDNEGVELVYRKE